MMTLWNKSDGKYIDHNYVGDQTSIDGALYIYDWDTQNIEDGEHVIYCITFDNYENQINPTACG